MSMPNSPAPIASGSSQGILVHDRRSGAMVEERVLGDRLLRLAYASPVKPLLAWPLFGTAFFSRLLGWYADTAFSRRKIEATASQLGINLDECIIPPGGFASFNDFFCRRLQPGARPHDPNQQVVTSPADCRLTVWPQLKGDTCLPVKGASFTVPELLGQPGADLVDAFAYGALCVCRLCPADYHRYHYPADGREIRRWRIGDKWHSVNPLALARNIKVFTTNIREVSILDLDVFGRAAFIEVGAFGVAAITQTHPSLNFHKGDEKGFFSFGGSTIIMLFQPDCIQFDQDLIDNSGNGVETLVQTGQQIAVRKTPAPANAGTAP